MNKDFVKFEIIEEDLVVLTNKFSVKVSIEELKNGVRNTIYRDGNTVEGYEVTTSKYPRFTIFTMNRQVIVNVPSEEVFIVETLPFTTEFTNFLQDLETHFDTLN